MSDENIAGLQTAVGEIPEDYAAFEKFRQPSPAVANAAADENTGDADAEAAGDESAGDDDGAPDDVEQDGADKPKKKGGWQRKIERQERENQDLRDRLARLEGTLAGKPATGEPAKPASDAAQGTPQGKPQAKDFDTYEEYTEKLTEWTIDQREAKREAAAKQKETQAKQKSEADTFLERVETARQKYADFDEVTASDIEISAAMQACIVRSEHGAEIGYHLAKNPTEALRIAKLDPIDAAREIGRLETRYAVAPKPKARPVSSAPEPITPIGGGRATAAASIDDPNIDFSVFEKKANARFRR